MRRDAGEEGGANFVLKRHALCPICLTFHVGNFYTYAHLCVYSKSMLQPLCTIYAKLVATMLSKDYSSLEPNKCVLEWNYTVCGGGGMSSTASKNEDEAGCVGLLLYALYVFTVMHYWNTMQLNQAAAHKSLLIKLCFAKFRVTKFQTWALALYFQVRSPLISYPWIAITLALI